MSNGLDGGFAFCLLLAVLELFDAFEGWFRLLRPIQVMTSCSGWFDLKKLDQIFSTQKAPKKVTFFSKKLRDLEEGFPTPVFKVSEPHQKR